MNNRIIALILVCIMLLCGGCGKKEVAISESTSTMEQQSGFEATADSESHETVPAVTENILDSDGFEEGVNEDDVGSSNGSDTSIDTSDNTDNNETQSGTDNTDNGAAANSPSDAGNAGQSGTGSNDDNAGNTGNTGNNSSGGNSGNTGNSANNTSSGNTGNSGSNTGNTGNANSNQGGSANSGTGNENAPAVSGGSTPAESTDPSTGIDYASYEDYINMTPDEQMAYYNQFPSMPDFVKWYNEAKAEYEKTHGAIDVGDGNINLGDLVKP